MDHKSFSSQPTFDEAGTVVARIATLNVKDHDGDVTLPGFFGEQKAPMIIGHDWSDLPVGKGRVYEEGDAAYFEGRFFLDTPQGEKAYKTAKAMAEDQEWSYGFDLLPGGAKKGVHNGEYVRLLQESGEGKAGTVVNEVSMVVRGAGIATQTVGIKDKEASESRGLKFVEEAQLVTKALVALVERAEAIADLRKGKLGATSVEALSEVHAELKDAEKVLTSFVVPDNGAAPSADELQAIRNRLLMEESVRLGVDVEGESE